VLFRQRSRLRPLSERECYLRLHGSRSGEIEVLEARSRPVPPPAPAPASAPEAPAPDGPTDCAPALHLVFNYPRGAGTLTGEQLRLELLRRMQGRAGEAA
jgi:hypothetical protein